MTRSLAPEVARPVETTCETDSSQATRAVATRIVCPIVDWNLPSACVICALGL